MSDPLSGHTAAQNTLGADGLRDGDALSSPTMTNMLQGLHGNGILRMQDSAIGATRNATNSGSQPGSMTRASAFTLTVQGGYVVLDGQLYEFGGGPGASVTVTIGNSSHGTGTAMAAANEQALYVLYVASDGGASRVHFAGGSPVQTGDGLYPTLPNQYLIDYNTGSSQVNEQVTVLATVRCEYKSSGGGNHNVDILEINDKRAFLRTNPMYMVPLTTASLDNDSDSKASQISRDAAEGVQTAADLIGLMASGEAGDFGTTVGSATQLNDVTALWVSTTKSGGSLGYGPDEGIDRDSHRGQDQLFFAGQENSETAIVSKRLFARGVSAPSAAQNTATYPITSYGDSVFILNVNSGQTVTLNPEKSGGGKYLFPEGHIIDVKVTGSGVGKFDATALNETISSTTKTFVYEGSEWLLLR